MRETKCFRNRSAILKMASRVNIGPGATLIFGARPLKQLERVDLVRKVHPQHEAASGTGDLGAHGKMVRDDLGRLLDLTRSRA